MGKSLFRATIPKIFDCLKKGLTKAQISRSLGVSKATMHRWFNKLEALGFVEREFKTNFISYKIKQNFVFSVGDGVGQLHGKIYRIHNLQVKFPIIKDSKLPYNKKRKMRQGVFFFYGNHSRLGAKWKKTNRSLIVFPRMRWVVNAKQGVVEMRRDAEKVRSFLQRTYGIELDEGIVNSKIHFGCEDPVAKKLHSRKVFFENDVGGLDNSFAKFGKNMASGEKDLFGLENVESEKLVDDYLRAGSNIAELKEDVKFVKSLMQGQLNVQQQFNQLMSVIANQQKQVLENQKSINKLIEKFGGIKNGESEV